MAKFKKKKNTAENVNIDENGNPVSETEETEEKFDKHGMENTVERIKAGLVGEYKILEDENTNKPMFKPGDIICLRIPSRLQKGDFVLYMVNEEYFIRRIIKFVEDDIYVAGDNEKEYHVVHKDDVVAKAISRERGKKWTSLTGLMDTKKLYTFRKVNLAKLRLGNRISTYDQDVNNEALELAMQNIEAKPAQEQEKKYVITIDLDSDLASFLNPDDLVKEWEESEAAERAANEEEVEYVDEEGNTLTKEEYEAALAAQEAAEGEEESEDGAEEGTESAADTENAEESEEGETAESKEESDSVGLTDEDL